jgi:hypothetical protein
VEQIRIALIDMPRTMVSEFVERALAEMREAKVVARVNGSADLIETVDEASADVAIAGASSADEDRLLALVTARPKVKALAVVGDGESAVLYDLAPRRTPLELSADALAAAIRLAQSSPTWAPAHQMLS